MPSGIPLSGSVLVGTQKPTDARYGPYASTALALADLTSGFRYKGLTVGIETDGIITEYWFNDGLSDADFVEKIAGGASLTNTVTPANLASAAAVGTSPEAARADHVHARPTPDGIGAVKAIYLPETQPTVRRIQVTASGTNRPAGLSEVTKLNFVGFFRGRPDYSTELGQVGDLGHTLLYWYDDLTQAGTTVPGMWVLDAYGDATSLLVKPGDGSSVLELSGSGWYRSGISFALGEAFNGTVTITEIPATFAGANGTAAGAAGLVPQPAATDNTKFLKGDGTWATVASTNPKASFGPVVISRFRGAQFGSSNYNSSNPANRRQNFYDLTANNTQPKGNTVLGYNVGPGWPYPFNPFVHLGGNTSDLYTIAAYVRVRDAWNQGVFCQLRLRQWLTDSTARQIWVDGFGQGGSAIPTSDPSYNPVGALSEFGGGGLGTNRIYFASQDAFIVDSWIQFEFYFSAFGDGSVNNTNGAFIEDCEVICFKK